VKGKYEQKLTNLRNGKNYRSISNINTVKDKEIASKLNHPSEEKGQLVSGELTEKEGKNQAKTESYKASSYNCEYLTSDLLTRDMNFDDHNSMQKYTFNVSELFSKIYQEYESEDVKLLKKEISEFYKTENSFRVPQSGLHYYKLLKLLGKGSFGKVYLGLQLLTNRLVAIKCLEKDSIKDKAIKMKILQEIDILKSVRHIPQISRLLEVFENKKYVFMVMLYAKDGDLLKYLKGKLKLTEDEARPIFLKILTGVYGLHRINVLHRDLKLDNILLHENLEPLICDFGVSRVMRKDELINEQCGTPAYIAPEIIVEKGYSGLKADIWSMGVLLFAMVTGKMPFKGANIDNLHEAIMNKTFTYPSDSQLSKELKDLIDRMLTISPEERISSEEMFSMSWFGLTPSKANELMEKTMDHRVVPIDNLVEQLKRMGYLEKSIRESLTNKKLNHISACYYNLERCLLN
jgi:5'-AMP-activated protein kinase catalytic alpha subunit